MFRPLSATRRVWVALLATTLLAGYSLAQGSHPRVKLATTAGDIIIELYPDKAPKTVENFLQYVRDKHYDGLIFHRVIDNFMIQGGGFDTHFRQKMTRSPIALEASESLARGGPGNTIATVAMARTNDPDSATSQFFINIRDNDNLDPNPRSPGYTVFGKVVGGFETVGKIKSTPTGPGGPFPRDVPQTPVVINSATIVK